MPPFFSTKRWRLALSCLLVLSCLPTAVCHAQTPAPHLFVPQDLGEQTLTISLAPGSSWFATGDFEHICIWNRADGRFLSKLPFPGPYQNQFAAISGSRLLAIADPDGLRIIDVEDFHVVSRIPVRNPIRWLHNLSNGDVLAATATSLIRFEGPAFKPRELATFTDEGSSTTYDLSDDESAVILSHYDSTSPQIAGSVLIYALADGAVLYRGQLKPHFLGLALHASTLVQATETNPDPNTANKLETQPNHGMHIELFDILRATSITSFELPQAGTIRGFFTDNGHAAFLVSSSAGLASYDLSGKRLASSPFSAFDSFPMAAASDRAGMLVVSDKGAPRVLDPQTLYPVSPAVHASRLVTDAAILPDGRIALVAGPPLGGESLAIGTQSELVTLGDTVETTELLGVANQFLHAFAGKPGLFAAGADRFGPSGFQVGPFSGFAQAVVGFQIFPERAVAIAPNGDLFASFAAQQTPDHATLLIKKPVSPTGDTLTQIAAWSLKSDATFSDNLHFHVEFLAHDLVLAVDEYTATLRRFRLSSKTELPPLVLPVPHAAGDPAPSLPLFLLAARAALTGEDVVIAQPGLTRCIRLSDGTVIGQLSPAATDVVAVAAATQHRYLLGHADGTLEFWDGKGPPIAFAALPSKPVAIMPVEASNLIVVSTTDGLTHFLDARTGQERLFLFLGDKGQWLVATPDGRFDSSDFGAGGTRWKFGPGTFAESMPVEAYTDDFIRPGLAAELTRPTKPGSDPRAPQLSLLTRQRKTATLTLTAQPLTAESATAHIVVHVDAPDGVAVRSLRLKRNGVLLKTWSADLHDGDALSITEPIVTGENRFTAYAYNQDDVKSQDGALLLYGPEKLVRPGALWIVAVGIDDYRNPAFHLNYATADARLAAWSLAWQRLRVQQQGQRILDADKPADRGKAVVNFTIDLLPSMGPPHVSLLLNADATRGHILETIRTVSHQARPEDTVVLFFAGHGIASGDRYYLLPQDLHFAGTPRELLANGQNALRTGAISDQDLREALTDEQAATAALILDACQSGAVIGDQAVQRRGPMNSPGLEQLAYDKGMYLLAASLSTETAAEQASIEHGVLTYTLFERGLVQDLASVDPLSFGHGLASLGDWLSWGSNNVRQDLDADQAKRGFDKVKAPSAALSTHVQRPRLFVPPPARQLTVVALSPTTIDPLVVSTQPPPGAEAAASSAVTASAVIALDALVKPAGASTAATPLTANAAFSNAGLKPNPPSRSFYPQVRFPAPGRISIFMGTEGSLQALNLPLVGPARSAVIPRDETPTLQGKIAFVESKGKLMRLNVDTLAALPSVDVGKVESLTLSLDGERAAWIVPDLSVTPAPTSRLRAVDLASGRALALSTPANRVLALRFMPDGHSLVALLAPPPDPAANTLQQLAGSVAILLLGSETRVKPILTPNLACCSVTISPEGGRLLSVSQVDGTGTLVDLTQRKVLRTLDFSTIPYVQVFDPNPASHIIVFGQQDGSLLWWDSDQPGPPKLIGTLATSIASVAFNPAGGVVASGTDGSLSWFRGLPVPSLQATSFWNQATGTWLTVLPDGSYSLTPKTVSFAAALATAPGRPLRQVPDLLPALLATP